MGTTSFDTTTVPHWRQTGTVDLAEPANVKVGDPCYGRLDIVNGLSLPAGTWVWEVRDANEAGEPQHRMWEVRLRRSGTDALDDWAWDDDYGQWATEPAPGARTVEHRGVDAATMAWQLAGPAAADLNTEALLWSEALGAPLHGGTVMVTSTGWGDGSYPVGVRHVAGEVVEVRMAFITPEPAALTAAQFAALLPGALDRGPEGGAKAVVLDGGPVVLTVLREQYTAMRDGQPDQLENHAYDTVTALTAGHPARTFSTRFDADDPDAYRPEVVQAVAHLWRRVGTPERAVMIDHERPGVAQAREPQGWIVAGTSTPVEIGIRI